MKRPSSLLIVAGSSPESFSPAGERIRHLALAGGSKFSKVLVLALQRSQRERNLEGNEGKVSLYSVSFSRVVPFPFSVLFDPVKTLMLLIHGLVLYSRIRPSHVLASMPPLETGMSAWIIAKIKHVPLVVDLRDDWESAANVQLKRFFPKGMLTILSTITRRIYSSASIMFAVTQTIAETMQKRNIKTEILLVPNGADTKVFAPKTLRIRRETRRENALPPERIIVVYCGSGVNPYYRLDLALSSFKILSEEFERKIFFVFYVYNGIESLRKLQGKLGISRNQLEIRDPLPRNQLAEVLAACDIGLVPFDAKEYLLCARSTKIYEYLSSGLYVVCSGPEGGELDVLLSSNAKLGTFVLPTNENFVETFKFASENEFLLGEDMRALRHSFIRENYDRQYVMRKAMDALFGNVPSA